MVSGLMDYKYSSIKDYMNEIVDILHENAIKHYKMKFMIGKNSSNIINPKIQIYLWISKEEVYIQKKRKSFVALVGASKRKRGGKCYGNFWKEGELRKVYKKRLKEELKISNKMLNKIYDELKLKIIG